VSSRGAQRRGDLERESQVLIEIVTFPKGDSRRQVLKTIFTTKLAFSEGGKKGGKVLEELIKTLQAKRDPQLAEGMAAYMKNQFPFLGIPKPLRTRLQKDFIKRAKRQGRIEWQDVYGLWDLPEREYQYVAMDYLVELREYLQPEDIHHLQSLIIMKSWWDTVDKLAAIPVGTLCLKHPELVKNYMLAWAGSDNLWLARTAILFQLKYKDKTDTKTLAAIIEKNCGSKEFFINKAIGWILREYSKTDPEWVRQFLQTHALAPLSVREASKYLR